MINDEGFPINEALNSMNIDWKWSLVGTTETLCPWQNRP